MAYEDIQAALRSQQDQAMKAATEQLRADVGRTWEQIAEATDHARESRALLDAGQERDFYLMSVGDLAAVRDAADAQMRTVAHALARHYGMTTAAIAAKAGVSQSTAYRWVAQVDADKP